MYLISATFVASPTAEWQDLPAGVVVDLLWTAARPEDGLEHVYCEPGPGRLECVLFLRASSAAFACEAVAAICRRVRESAPPLHAWHLAAAPCARTGA